MERKKHKNEVTGNYYSQKDFLIGKTIYLNSYRFQIVEADEYTEKYMEDNPEFFPQATITYIMNKIKEGAAPFPSINDFAVSLVQKMNAANKDGSIDIENLNQILRSFNVFLTDHELHTIYRKLDHHRTGKLSIEEFYNNLS